MATMSRVHPLSAHRKRVVATTRAYRISAHLSLAGIPGFLGNLENVYTDADDETPAWTAFLLAIKEQYGNMAFTTARLARDLLDPARVQLREDLPVELADAIDRPTSLAKRLGKAFSRKEETRFIVGEHGETVRIIRAGSIKRSIRWTVG